MKNIAESPFQSFDRPLPPPSLQERTLRAAFSALAAPAKADLWVVLWESVWLRIAWSAGVAALLVSHVVISTDNTGSAGKYSMPVVVAIADLGNELSEVVCLSRINASLPSLVGLQEAAVDSGTRKTKGEVS